MELWSPRQASPAPPSTNIGQANVVSSPVLHFRCSSPFKFLPPLEHRIRDQSDVLCRGKKINLRSQSSRAWLAQKIVVAAASTPIRNSRRELLSATGPVKGAEREPVSIIIPVYNEVRNIPILVEKVGAAMRRRGGPYEIICVDDGSTDGSTLLLKAMAAEREDLRVIVFRRNFGQTAAMAAGFDYAAGDLLVTLDGDLQNDPEDIPRLLHRLVYGDEARLDDSSATGTSGRSSSNSSTSSSSGGGGGAASSHAGARAGGAVAGGGCRDDGGYDLVCGWRRQRRDDALTRNLPSAVANWLIGRVTGVRLHDYGCSLKAYRKSLVQNLSLYGEMHRFIPALAAAEGAAIAEMEVTHHPRAFGKSKYGLGRVPRVLCDLATVTFLARFRDRPMRLFGALAAACALAALASLLWALASLAASARAWGTAMALSASSPLFMLSLDLGLTSMQFLGLGFIAELCMRTYFESQQQRSYRVREVAM